jgi:hypothetical protein
MYLSDLKWVMLRQMGGNEAGGKAKGGQVSYGRGAPLIGADGR